VAEQEHWKAAKKVIRYLIDTTDHGIYFKRSKTLTLQGYFDSDFAPKEHNRKSTTGYVFFINNTPVSWKTQLQKRTALSTCEAELEAMLQASKEAIFLRKLLYSFGYSVQQATTIFCDNVSAITVAKEPRGKRNTKHLDTKYFFLKEVIDDGQVMFVQVNSKDNLAELFTKPLVGESFFNIRNRLVRS